MKKSIISESKGKNEEDSAHELSDCIGYELYKAKIKK